MVDFRIANEGLVDLREFVELTVGFFRGIAEKFKGDGLPVDARSYFEQGILRMMVLEERLTDPDGIMV